MKVQMKRKGGEGGKMDKKGGKKRGKGALHYCLNVHCSTTQEAQGAKRGEEGEVINWQRTTKFFSPRTG